MGKPKTNIGSILIEALPVIRDRSEFSSLGSSTNTGAVFGRMLETVSEDKELLELPITQTFVYLAMCTSNTYSY
jgi:hypothetical protein